VKTLLTIMLLATTSFAAQNVTYEWTAPTTGSAVERYVFQLSLDGADFVTIGYPTNESYEVIIADGVEVSARVAGIDALDRQGPWSENSDPYTDHGPPGQPGKPTIIAIIAGMLLLLLGFFVGRRK